MKIAILGGSFNPIHLGHIHIAEQAIKILQVDKVLFVPVGLHHFKTTDSTPYEVRFNWTKKAIAQYPNYEISDLDSPDYGISFTKNLLIRLREQHPNDKFLFIAGADILESLHKWHDYEWLLNNANFAFFTRPGLRAVDNKALPKEVTFFEMEPVAISSTEIRKLASSGKDFSNLVPAKIVEDIQSYYNGI